MGPEIIVCSDERSFTERACARIIDAAAEAIGNRGTFRIALAGGSTPKPIYAALALSPVIDWSRWELFWSDERTVPPDSPESNFGMVAEALLDPLAGKGVQPGRVERMRGEGDPHEAARAYDEMLRTLGNSTVPRFDLILLGMGADGHTASLFPHTAALAEGTRCVVANEVPQLHTERLTFTYLTLNAARRVLFLVRGHDKAATLRKVLEGPRDVATLPSQGVSPTQGTVTWLLDDAAAESLTR